MAKGFIDYAKIHVQGGDGGDGCRSFRREKFVPMGGPDGADGGKGGDIIVQASRNVHTLAVFSRKVHYKAGHGSNGEGGRRMGANGDEIVIEVPLGTRVIDSETRLCLGDLLTEGDSCLVARGGRGGRGNMHFATAERRAPRFYEKKELGEGRWIEFELQLMADVGLIGFPNAGKSSFLTAITRAHSKVADYPFTTLFPVLGVVQTEDYESAVFADLPGLIEGAAEGVGLGHQFLKHVERTKVLLHVIDVSEVDPENPIATYETIRRELERYNPDLLERPELVALNKLDLPDLDEVRDLLVQELVSRGKKVYGISCLLREGLEPLVKDLIALAKTVPPPEPEESYPLPPRYNNEIDVYWEDGVWMIEGDKVEALFKMTDILEDESLRNFQRKMIGWGVQDKLLDAGAEAGDTLRILNYLFDFEPVFDWMDDQEEMQQVNELRPSQTDRLKRKRELKSIKEMASKKDRQTRSRSQSRKNLRKGLNNPLG